MASFAELPPQDRWAPAVYAGAFAYPESEAKAGKTLWDGDADLRQRLDLEKLVGTTPAALAAQVGEDKARQLTAYLRRHPEATVAAEAAGTLTLALKSWKILWRTWKRAARYLKNLKCSKARKECSPMHNN